MDAAPRPLPLLWQTEWCPASQRVRQRLTELDIAFVAVPVPVEREDRVELRRQTGGDSIPVLVGTDGTVVAGETAILDVLAHTYDEPAGAEAHRVKAERARRRQLEEARAA
jgi:glutathione S-transferase